MNLNKTDTWTYDVAGSRTDAVKTFDNLNRMMAIASNMAVLHDAVGNRTAQKLGTQTSKLYTWDTRNRLESYSEPNMTNGNVVTVGSGAANYDYLPNGLRCTKIWDGNVEQVEIEGGEPVLSGFYDSNSAMNDNTTRYRYDGQMTIEEDVTFLQGEYPIHDQTSYLVGARGYEMIEAKRLASPDTNDPLMVAKRSYPIYDGHGNMIATLAKNGVGYNVANEKKYDVWGSVRSSGTTGNHVVNPNKQYCANLGHTFDGESNLIFM